VNYFSNQKSDPSKLNKANNPDLLPSIQWLLIVTEAIVEGTVLGAALWIALACSALAISTPLLWATSALASAISIAAILVIVGFCRKNRQIDHLKDSIKAIKNDDSISTNEKNCPSQEKSESTQVQIEQLTSELLAKHQENEKLLEEKEDLLNQFTKMSEEQVVLRNQLEELKNQQQNLLDQSNEAAQREKEELIQLQNKNKTIRNQLKKLETQHTIPSQSKKTTHEDNAQLQKEINGLKSEIETQKVAIEGLKKRADTLTCALFLRDLRIDTYDQHSIAQNQVILTGKEIIGKMVKPSVWNRKANSEIITKLNAKYNSECALIGKYEYILNNSIVIEMDEKSETVRQFFDSDVPKFISQLDGNTRIKVYSALTSQNCEMAMGILIQFKKMEFHPSDDFLEYIHTKSPLVTSVFPSKQAKEFMQKSIHEEYTKMSKARLEYLAKCKISPALFENDENFNNALNDNLLIQTLENLNIFKDIQRFTCADGSREVIINGKKIDLQKENVIKAFLQHLKNSGLSAENASKALTAMFHFEWNQSCSCACIALYWGYLKKTYAASQEKNDAWGAAYVFQSLCSKASSNSITSNNKIKIEILMEGIVKVSTIASAVMEDFCKVVTDLNLESVCADRGVNVGKLYHFEHTSVSCDHQGIHTVDEMDVFLDLQKKQEK
jgi:uncharacterized membrane protein YgaE (UPF0421/DUF939 family)